MMTQQDMQIYMTNIGISCKVRSMCDYVTDNEKGYLVIVDIPDYMDGVEYYVPEIKDISGIVNHSGMPKEYMNKRFRDFNMDFYGKDMSMVQRVLEKFVEKFNTFMTQGRGLYIFSQTKGSGKSLLACCIANEVLQNYQISCKFITITDYIDMYRNKNPALDRIRDADLLIIDDLGIQDETKEWINEIVYNLVDRRYRNQCVTIYTSNRNFKEKDISAEDRIASRVYGQCIPVQLPEVSVRAKLADKYRENFMRELFA